MNNNKLLDDVFHNNKSPHMPIDTTMVKQENDHIQLIVDYILTQDAKSDEIDETDEKILDDTDILILIQEYLNNLGDDDNNMFTTDSTDTTVDVDCKPLIDNIPEYYEKDVETKGISRYIRGKTRNVKNIKTPESIRLLMNIDFNALFPDIEVYSKMNDSRTIESGEETSDFNGKNGEHVLTLIKTTFDRLADDVQDLELLYNESVTTHKHRVHKFGSELKVQRDTLKKTARTSGLDHWLRGQTRQAYNIKSIPQIQIEMKNVFKKLDTEIIVFNVMWVVRNEEIEDKQSDFNGFKGKNSIESIKVLFKELKHDIQDLRLLRDASVKVHRKRIADITKPRSNTVKMDAPGIEITTKAHFIEVGDTLLMHSDNHTKHISEQIKLQEKLSALMKRIQNLEIRTK